jgi:hypothetical protein
MMAISSGLFGAAAMFAWCLVTATMIVIDGSYWELFLVQQILWRAMLWGDQFQNIFAQFNFTAIWRRQMAYKEILFAQRKRVIF